LGLGWGSGVKDKGWLRGGEGAEQAKAEGKGAPGVRDE
jgi:hypothetical protein